VALSIRRAPARGVPDHAAYGKALGVPEAKEPLAAAPKVKVKVKEALDEAAGGCAYVPATPHT
jgi:hypothetical protein